MKRVVLANASVNSGNLGCRALTVSACSVIREVVTSHGEEVEFILPDSYLPDAPFYPIPLRLKEFLKYLVYFKRYCKSYRAFSKSDLIMDIGEGDSFSDIYGEYRFRKIDRIHVTARALRKKYVLLPQTIGPFNGEAVRRKAVKSLRNAHSVMCRDEESRSYAESICPGLPRLDSYIDVAFFLPYEKTVFTEKYVHVGINISALLWNGGYTRDNQFGLKCDYRQLINSALDFFLSKENVCVHLIPHVLLSVSDVENDYEVCSEIVSSRKSERLVLAPFFSSPEEAKGYISGMDFFTGARMHSTIAAFSSGVPVVPMAYSRKFGGLFESSLNYPFMIDLCEKDNDECLLALRAAFERRNEIKDLIALRIREIIEPERAHLVGDIKKILYGDES